MKALKGLKWTAEAFYVCNTSIVLSGSSKWNPACLILMCIVGEVYDTDRRRGGALLAGTIYFCSNHNIFTAFWGK